MNISYIKVSDKNAIYDYHIGLYMTSLETIYGHPRAYIWPAQSLYMTSPWPIYDQPWPIYDQPRAYITTLESIYDQPIDLYTTSLWPIYDQPRAYIKKKLKKKRPRYKDVYIANFGPLLQPNMIFYQLVPISPY